MAGGGTAVVTKVSCMKVGVNIALFEDEKILLTKRKDFGVWCLPGGHIDPGESVAQAAIREVSEETGLKIELIRLVGIYSIPKATAWVNLIILFVGKKVGGELKAQEDEVVDIATFAMDELPTELLWGHRQRILDAFSRNDKATVWLQHVPFDSGLSRHELYKLRDESGLSEIEFYSKYFGLVLPRGDLSELDS